MPGKISMLEKDRYQYLEYPFIKRHRNIVLSEIDCYQQGLEIGPYDKPWIIKPEYDIKYFDRFSKEHLSNYANRNRDITNIVDLDIVADNIGDIEGNFDYIFGSHFFEHLPNPIEFLVDSFTKLSNGGKIILVIPDARYTFDLCRPRTTVSDYLNSFLEKHKKPSPRSVFDSIYYRCSKSFIHQDLWENPKKRHDFFPRREINEAFDKAIQSTESYVDCHVTITTSELFYEHMDELNSCGILRYSDLVVHPTPFNSNDFLAVFVK